MKKITAAALFGLAMSFSAPPVFGGEVDINVDASPDVHVDISIVSGSITVDSWSRESVEVTGSIGRNVKDIQVIPYGDRVKIKLEAPHKSGRGIDADLHIKMPKQGSLDVGTVSADIEVSEVFGEQSLHSVSGDIVTEFSGEDIDAESVSGEIEIAGDNSEGDVEASSVSGDVTLYRVSGDVTVETVTGNLVVDEGAFDRADLDSVNGRVQFLGQLKDDGRLYVETINGSVEVELEGKVSAKIAVETLNGSIRNCFGPKPVRTSKYGPGKELEFVEGNGDGRIDISTLNGGINLCRE